MPLGSLAGSGLASKILTVLPSSVHPGAGRRIAAADQRIDLPPGLAPVDLGVAGTAAAFVGGLRFVLLDARRLAGLHQIDRLQHGLDAHGEQAVEIDRAEGVGAEIGVFFCISTSPVSSPLSGQKIDRPVSFSPRMIGQLMADGAAIGRQQRGMILDRAVGRDVEEVLRHEQRDEGHHLQVGLERLELLPDLRVLVGRRLIDRQLGGERRFLQRIGLGAFLLRRDIDRDHLHRRA